MRNAMLSEPPDGLAPRTPWRRSLSAVRVVVTLGLLGALFFLFGLRPGRLLDALSDADLPELALACAVISGILLLLALKWCVIARGLTLPLTFASGSRLYLTGMVLNTALPTAIGGDAYRVYSLSRQAEAGFRRPLLSVIVERASGYAGLLALSAPAAALYFLDGALAALLAIGALGFMAAAYAALRGLADPAGALSGERWSRRRWWRLPFPRPTLDLVAALSILQQAMWVSAAALFGLAYDASVPWTYWALTVTAMTLLTVAPVSVGGLGLREIGYVTLLKPLDVEPHQAAAIGLAMGFAPALLSLVMLMPLAAAGTRPRRAPAAAPKVAPEVAPADRS